MHDTPSSERLRIGLFGRCNSGKSTLLNTLAGQQAALVSAAPGTTTDPVNKAMELPGLGAVVVTDTAGFDDRSPLGAARCAQTERIARRCDLAVIVCPEDAGCGECHPAVAYRTEAQWVARFRAQGVPVVALLNRRDPAQETAAGELFAGSPASAATPGQRPTVGVVAPTTLTHALRALVVVANAATGEGLDRLLEELAAAAGNRDADTITGDLAAAGDVAVLVMPQDAGAPRGRLILPQAQTLRELLDKGCTAVCCTPDHLARTLQSLAAPPRLIVTDSQAFAAVSALKPEATLLTSFSVLYAGYKGDINLFIAGAAAIDRLTERSRVLIAEACTHAPAEEDIGRVKLPRLLRRRAGGGLRVEVVAGADFPDDLRGYDLVIHCGGCMFTRRHVLSRIRRAEAQGVPVTNYGVALAALTGILPQVAWPGRKAEL